MSLIITLTEPLRAIPYFSDFKEEQVEVPDKPFVRELLSRTLCHELLSIPELLEAITTCIYFALDSKLLCRELLWKIGVDKETFSQWFTPGCPGSETWFFGPNFFPAIIKAELARVFQLVRSVFYPKDLARLGLRYPKPSNLALMEAGNLRLLEWFYHLVKSRGETFWAPGMVLTAAKHGHLSCLEYAFNQGCPQDWKEDQDADVYAAENGHLDCLWHLRGLDPFPILNFKVCAAAAKGGKLDCLKYLHENGYPWDDLTCYYATRNGHLDCLRYAHEQGCLWRQADVVHVAAARGHLACLEYVLNQGYPCFKTAHVQAAENGHLDCLQYLHENGYPWDKKTCEKSAENGHLACLRYACEQGCPWSMQTYILAVKNGHLACLEFLCSQSRQRILWDPVGLWNTAAMRGRLDCLKYLHSQGFPWEEETCGFAAVHGHLDALKYLHEQGCPWDARVCFYASKHGHIACLKYARENVCPWDVDRCESEAQACGHRACLDFIIDNKLYS